MMTMDYAVCFALLAMGELRALFMIPLSFTAFVCFLVRAPRASNGSAASQGVTLHVIIRIYHSL